MVETPEERLDRLKKGLLQKVGGIVDAHKAEITSEPSTLDLPIEPQPILSDLPSAPPAVYEERPVKLDQEKRSAPPQEPPTMPVVEQRLEVPAAPIQQLIPRDVVASEPASLEDVVDESVLVTGKKLGIPNYSILSETAREAIDRIAKESYSIGASGVVVTTLTANDLAVSNWSRTKAEIKQVTGVDIQTRGWYRGGPGRKLEDMTNVSFKPIDSPDIAEFESILTPAEYALLKKSTAKLSKLDGNRWYISATANSLDRNYTAIADRIFKKSGIDLITMGRVIRAPLDSAPQQRRETLPINIYTLAHDAVACGEPKTYTIGGKDLHVFPVEKGALNRSVYVEKSGEFEKAGIYFLCGHAFKLFSCMATQQDITSAELMRKAKLNQNKFSQARSELIKKKLYGLVKDRIKPAEKANLVYKEKHGVVPPTGQEPPSYNVDASMASLEMAQVLVKLDKSLGGHGLEDSLMDGAFELAREVYARVSSRKK